MSRIDRRSMLKVMAATTAGGAAAIAGLGETALAASGPGSPGPSTPEAASGPRLATAAGAVYRYLDGTSDFNFRISSTTWSQGSPAGSIYPISTAGDFLWTNLHLPHGVLLTEIILSVVVNDANPATWFLWQRTPSSSGNAALASGSIATTSVGTQNISLPFTPVTIDNSQNYYGIYYGFGTANSPSTHVFHGARLGYINAPGLTSFLNPRRVVSSAMVSGTTYGPFDATTTVTATPSGVPAGAQAAFCAVQSYTPGVLTLFPDGATDPMIANYSGTGTQGAGLNVIYMLVPLSAAGKFKIHSYITGNVYVDVWGFLSQPG